MILMTGGDKMGFLTEAESLDLEDFFDSLYGDEPDTDDWLGTTMYPVDAPE